MVRTSELSNVRVRQLADPLIVYTVGSADSISASPDWRSSFDWATRQRAIWAAATMADFLASQTLRYALQGRDWRGAREIISTIRECGRPSVRASLSALAGTIPRRLAENTCWWPWAAAAAGERRTRGKSRRDEDPFRVAPAPPFYGMEKAAAC